MATTFVDPESRDGRRLQARYRAQGVAALLAFANLEATPKAGGCGFDDIVDMTTFHTDPENQFGTIMTVKSEIFPTAPYPNWTAIGVNWLAGFDFEIKVIARAPLRSSNQTFASIIVAVSRLRRS